MVAIDSLMVGVKSQVDVLGTMLIIRIGTVYDYLDDEDLKVVGS